MVFITNNDSQLIRQCAWTKIAGDNITDPVDLDLKLNALLTDTKTKIEELYKAFEKKLEEIIKTPKPQPVYTLPPIDFSKLDAI